MQIWLARTRTTATWEELEKILPRHLERETALAEAGVLILAGPLPRADGSLDGDGLAIYYAASEQEARQLAQDDPFICEGVRAVVSVEQWDVRRVGWRVGELTSEHRPQSPTEAGR